MSQFWTSAKHTILVTGGGSGIGFGFAKRWAAAGHKVIITGRRSEQLAKAQDECPDLVSIVGDVSTEAGRQAIFDTVINQHPDLTVLCNNAGIQNRLPPLASETPSHAKDLWGQHKAELATNLEAPMHLSMLFLPHLLSKPSARIINVTSGLSFVPIAAMPTYCASKAALHSFTLSLRQQLLATSVSVCEIIPPAVNTDLGGDGLHTFGENLDEFSDHTMSKMMESDDNLEIGYKMSENLRNASAEERQASFKAMNSWSH